MSHDLLVQMAYLRYFQPLCNSVDSSLRASLLFGRVKNESRENARAREGSFPLPLPRAFSRDSFFTRPNRRACLQARSIPAYDYPSPNSSYHSLVFSSDCPAKQLAKRGRRGYSLSIWFLRGLQEYISFQFQMRSKQEREI